MERRWSEREPHRSDEKFECVLDRSRRFFALSVGEKIGLERTRSPAPSGTKPESSPVPIGSQRGSETASSERLSFSNNVLRHFFGKNFDYGMDGDRRVAGRTNINAEVRDERLRCGQGNMDQIAPLYFGLIDYPCSLK